MDYELLKKRFSLINNVNSILQKYNNIENDNDRLNKIMKDKDLWDDSICFLIGEYYLFESTLKEEEQLNPHYLQIIKENYNKRAELCYWFRDSCVFALNIINNYQNSGLNWYNKEKILEKFNKNEANFINELSPMYNYINNTYITTIIRVSSFNLLSLMRGFEEYYSCSVNVDLDIELLLNNILSDIYSYMKFEKIDDEIMNDFNKLSRKELKKKFVENYSFFIESSNYYFDLYKNGYPNFYEIYMTNEHQDENYKSKILKLNPFYNIDKLSAYTNRDIKND